MQVLQSLFRMSLLALLMSSAYANSYALSDSIVGNDFYEKFDWEALGGSDPTHGRVNYVDQQTSIDQNLTFASDDAFIIRADYESVLDPNGPGRSSVRIKSKNVYTKHVVIFDLRHMPQGCGTWPAVWEMGQADWPQGGEIDIIEGINDQPPNSAVLHTTDGCTMPAQRNQTGSSGQLDCKSSSTANTGCIVHLSGGNSYGPSFNSNGGGWYVLERSNYAINIWFWSRSDSSVPNEVKEGSDSVNPGQWGTPSATFPSTSCDLDSHFDELNILINLTFCGDWAGPRYSDSGCPSTCVDFVNNNPTAFTNAYFEFASIRIYT